jgi:hypothetical protein
MVKLIRLSVSDVRKIISDHFSVNENEIAFINETDYYRNEEGTIKTYVTKQIVEINQPLNK